VSSVFPDASRTFFNLIVWAQLELQLGIMCASAPSLRSFFRRYLGGSLSSRATGSDDVGRDTPSLPKSKVGAMISSFSRSRLGKNDYSVNEITMETNIESTSVHRGWSATLSNEHLTRSSTGGDTIPLQDMWKDPGQSQYDDRV
jgi:hypothetical protein